LGLDCGADGMFSYSPSTILHPPCSSLPNTASHDDAASRDEVGDLSGLGLRVPEDVAFIGLSGGGDMVQGRKVTGVINAPESLAEPAVDSLDVMIRANERGVPSHRNALMIEPEWVEGESCPGLYPCKNSFRRSE